MLYGTRNIFRFIKELYEIISSLERSKWNGKSGSLYFSQNERFSVNLYPFLIIINLLFSVTEKIHINGHRTTRLLLITISSLVNTETPLTTLRVKERGLC